MRSRISPKKLIYWAIVIALPVTALLGIALSRHAQSVLPLYLSGRAGNCTLAESFEAEALARAQNAGIAEARSSSRKIRTDGRYALWSTPEGEFWMPSASWDPVMLEIGEQKRNIYGSRIHQGDIVLDAGASIGLFTRKALRAGASKVIAIEPAPDNLECLRRNFPAEVAAGRVVIVPKGIWDREDVLKLWVNPADSSQDTFLGRAGNTQYVEAPLTTIDNLVAELKLPRVDFIKMDIEGAERRAIAGGKNTIAKFRPRMALCIYHVVGDETAIPKLVHEIVPDYTVTQACLCGEDRIQPEVAFFY
jgi:FkbM family methyltransferase